VYLLGQQGFVLRIFGEHLRHVGDAAGGTNRDTCPLVYVNKAFEELVRRPSRKLLGKRLNVMNEPETELTLLERLLEAQRCNLPCKVAITHYAAGGERFLDLLALRPSGGYSFAVHCPAYRGTWLSLVY
jgi:hypothetical protein